MSEDWRDYDVWLVPSRLTGNRTFHSGRDCDVILKPEKLVERSESYMEHYEPTPCPFCHKELDFPDSDSEEWRDSLRSMVSD